MINREIMLSALTESIFPVLEEQGFTGKYPNFRRKLDNCIELISFQTNKYGGSFTIEVSAVFPNAKNTNYQLYEDVTEETFGIEATNMRYRLPGMFDGWFYYRDVYRKRTLLFGSIYYDVPEKQAIGFVPPKGYKLVQKFDKNAAKQLCAEINKQLISAYKWLKAFEKCNKEQQEKE